MAKRKINDTFLAPVCKKGEQWNGETRQIRGFVFNHEVAGKKHRFIIECLSEWTEYKTTSGGKWNDKGFYRLRDFATGVPVFHFEQTITNVENARRNFRRVLDQKGEGYIATMNERISRKGLKRINKKKEKNPRRVYNPMTGLYDWK